MAVSGVPGPAALTFLFMAVGSMPALSFVKVVAVMLLMTLPNPK